MSRGRPRHHASRRRAYSGRQREVRERRERLAHEESDWIADDPEVVDRPPAADRIGATWGLRLQGRATAA